MTPDAVLLVALLAATLACFVLELVPVDVTALGLLFALLATGLVPMDAALEGFSNRGVLIIAGLFVLGHALTGTGALEAFGERLSGRFAHRPWLGLGSLLLIVALLSGFLNNTAVVALAIPLAVNLCGRFGISTSKVLMPLSYAAIFGGTLTLIGTSTNLLVSSIVEQRGGEPLDMFEFTPLGAVMLVAGLGYVVLLGPRLPPRAQVGSLTRTFGMEQVLTELRVVDGSVVVGHTVQDLRLNERYDVTVVEIIRERRRITTRLRTERLRPGDTLLVRTGTPDLMRLRRELGLALISDVKLGDRELSEGGQVVVEALVGPRSDLIDRTLAGAEFRQAHGAFVLAIRREGETLRDRLAHTPLRMGDTLLVIVARDRLGELRRDGDLVVVSELDLRLRRERLWWLPIPLIPAVVALAALDVVDLLVGVLGAVVLLLGVGVIRPRESYRSVDWQVVVFIAAFIPVGTAMIETGLADTLARAALVPGALVPDHLAPWVAVSVLYLATSLATEMVTNNAAAIVLTPVALTMGTELGVDSRPLVLAVCFAASASFMTPTGYQTNMMVYGPGNYRFLDFTRFGAPLNLLFWLLASVLLPVLYPF